uniref:DDE Tnp4 domain-containing protein n=1 Tax=Paramormyrops kingsleyae TaxID=1676925 RepID=A0A3B3SD89_9TELE
MSTLEEILIFIRLRRHQRRKQKSRRWYIRPINRSRQQNGEFFSLVLPMRDIDEEKHREYFRMSPKVFDELLRRIRPHIEHNQTHSDPIGSAQRLAVTLRFLTTGMSYRALAASYKLGSATVGRVISEVSQVIWVSLKNEFVAYPDQTKWQSIKGDFLSLWNYPNCLGSIDGKHIRVQAPRNSGSQFHNYKGYFSFILMAVCDARYRFSVVDIGAYGRDSDAGVFSRSQFGSKLIQGKLPLPPPSKLPGSEVLCPQVFVGDEAFPLKVNIMRPYPGTLTPDQQVYNYRHSRARRVVENAFGILSAKWRVFGKAMECSIDSAQHITKACVALHNFLCVSDQFEGPGYISCSLVDEGDVPGEWRQVVLGDSNLTDPGCLTADRATRVAADIRNRFKDYFLTDSGSVPFQDAVLHRGKLQ